MDRDKSPIRPRGFEPHAGPIRSLLAETTNLTIEELRVALTKSGIATSYRTPWRFFSRHKITARTHIDQVLARRSRLELNTIGFDWLLNEAEKVADFCRGVLARWQVSR